MADLLSRFDQRRARSPGRSAEDCVRAVARDVIEELGIAAPPVNLEMVASYLDIRAIESHDLDEAGCLVVGPAGGVVRLRASDSPQRQRFTLAHECGHTFHAGYQAQVQYRCNPTVLTDDELERLCDVAASGLLLPRALLTRDVVGQPLGRAQLDESSARYEASLIATALAMIDCFPHPSALLVFEVSRAPRQPTAEPKLRLRWSGTRGSWPYIRQHKSVADGDVFDRAHEGEIVHERCATITGVTAREVEAEVHAWRADYFNQQGARVERVLALLSRPWEARAVDG